MISLFVPNRPAYISTFLFNDSPTTEIYTLSLHDALPISKQLVGGHQPGEAAANDDDTRSPRLHTATSPGHPAVDRKSTRLNSSHANISYAVFCLKKKKKLCHSLTPT